MNEETTNKVSAAERAADTSVAEQEMDDMLSTLTRRRASGMAPSETTPENLSADAVEIARQRDEYRGDLQRLAAEFDNFQKRSAREKETAANLARVDLIRQMLPVLDNIERALAVVGSEQSDIADGMRMVQREVESVFNQQGVEEIDTSGTFDPHMHEPLLTVPSEQEEGTIVEVLQRGYRINNQILRPARVSVAAAKEN